MLNLAKCTPEYARELLRDHRTEWVKMNRSLARCKRLIEDRKDYSFLLEIGYSIGNEESFQNAYDILEGEACFLEVLLIPFMDFLRIVPVIAFYTNDAPIHSRIVSIVVYFTVLSTIFLSILG